VYTQQGNMLYPFIAFSLSTNFQSFSIHAQRTPSIASQHTEHDTAHHLQHFQQTKPTLHSLLKSSSLRNSVLKSFGSYKLLHLLKANTDGSFGVIGFVDNKIPRHAILSHTLDADNQEATFQDLMNGAGSRKAGYRRIQFCGEQANSRIYFELLRGGA